MKSENRLGTSKTIRDALSFYASSFFWKEDRPNWAQYLMEILNNLQLIAITLIGSSLFLPSSADDTAPGILIKTAKAFSLVDIAVIGTDETLLKLAFVGISIYLFLFVGITIYIFVKYVKGSKLSSFWLLVITYWAQLHHALFFWIVNVILMSSFSSNLAARIAIFNLSEKNTFLVTFSTVLLVFNYFFAGIAATFCFDPFLTNNAFSSYNSRFQRLTFVHKAIISPVILFIPNMSSLKWLFVLLSLALTIIRYEIVLVQVSFYKFSALKLTSLMASWTVGLAIANTIAAILSESNQMTPLDVIYVEVLAIGLLSKLTLSRLNNLVNRNFSLTDDKLNTQENVLRRTFAIAHFADNANFALGSTSKRVCNMSLLNIIGDFSSHTENCTDPKCLCRSTLSQGGQKDTLFEVHKFNNTYKVNLQFEILSNAMKSVKKDNVFRILTAYILVKEYQNFSAALFTIFGIGQKRSFKEGVLIYYVSQLLEEEIIKFHHYATDAETNLNVKEAVDFEMRSEQLFTLVEKTTSDYSELWDYFRQANMSLNEFLKRSVRIEKEADRIKNIWNNMLHSGHPFSQHSLVLYSSFLMTARNLPSEAEKIYQEYKTHEKERNAEYFLSKKELQDPSNDMIFYVSLARDRLGDVLHVSRNIYQELGWMHTELINRNINKIQAPFIHEKHDQILQRHIEGGKQSIISNFQGFAQNRDGYLVPVAGKVSILPYVGRAPIYVGVLSKREIESEYIIIRKNGIVDSFSEGFGKELSLNPYKRTHFRQLCAEYEQIISKLDASMPRKSEQSFGEETTLTFLANGSSSNKEVTYVIRVETMTILEERSLCLYLYDPQIRVKTANDLSNEIEEFTELGIQEFDSPLPSLRKIDINNSDSMASPDNSLALKRAKSSFLMQVLTRRPEEPMTSERTLALNSPNNSAAEFLNKSKRFPDLLKENEFVFSQSTRGLIETTDKYYTGGLGTINENMSQEFMTSKERVDIGKKLEEAIYRVPRDKMMRILDYVMACFAASCGLLIGSHLIYCHFELTPLLDKVDMIVNVGMRAISLATLNTNIIMLALVNDGIMSEQRHARVGIPSWSAKTRRLLQDNLQSLYTVNSQILHDSYILKTNSQREINDYVITLKQLGSRDVIDEVNHFEAITELANAANRIYQMDLASITFDNPAVVFMMDNALNDPLLASEKILDVVQRDYKSTLDSVFHNVILLLGMIVAGSVIVSYLVFLDLREFVRKRSQFIEILCKIDDNKLEEYMRAVAGFQQHLQSNRFRLRIYQETKVSLGAAVKRGEMKNTKKRNQHGSQKGLNNEMIKAILFIAVCLLMIISLFISLTFRFSSRTDQFSQKKGTLLQAARLKTEVRVETGCMLMYTSQNKTGIVRNRPVANEWQEILARSVSYPQILLDFLKSTGDGDYGLLEAILQEDVCKGVSIPGMTAEMCKQQDIAFGSTGLITVLSNFINSHIEAKSYFDQSNFTVQAAYEALSLNSVLAGEEMFPIMNDAGDTILSIFKDDLRQSIRNYEIEIIGLGMAYAAAYIVCGCIFMLKVWKSLKQERQSWRRIMRQIPYPIVCSNKALKAFLINNCDYMLDSLKNVI